MPCTVTEPIREEIGPSRLAALWRAGIVRARAWRALALRAAGKRKTLAVCETAGLGDRRFVSVIRFERQRFLVASSPASVTLLAQLPDEPPNQPPDELPNEPENSRAGR
jgi:flagellar biogenesis protein FliO